MATPRKADIDQMTGYERQFWRDARSRHNRRDRERGHPAQRSYAERNPIRQAVQVAVQNALRSGLLVKPSLCEQCNQPHRFIDGHHDDYAKPLDVRWLCRACHKDWHRINGPGINGDKEEFDMGMLDRFDQFEGKTFADAVGAYLAEFEGKSLIRQQYALQHLMPYIGDLPLIDVDDQALATYKAERREEAMAGTINKELSTATAVLNKAARVWRWIPAAPKLQRVRGENRRPYPISWDEQIAVFFRLSGDEQKICLFAVNTGCRREEIFKLKWADQRDIDGVMVFILRDTKNGCDRAVVCNSIARRIVGHMEGIDPEHVFPYCAINKIFNQAWTLAGLPDDPLIKKGIHNLRHTFGYRLRAEGVPGEDRDALLGHHNQSLTQHYAVPDIKRLAEMAERVTTRRDTAILR